jgi:sugar phosphate isomerase/epimerase
MLPTPRRAVKSYNVRFSLREILNDGQGPPSLRDAVDLHAHAAPGTEDPLLLVQRASRAGMGIVVLKNLRPDQPPHVTAAAVKEQLARWCDAEGIAPCEVYHGTLTDPGDGGLDFASVREAIDHGAKVVWMPVISSAHNLYRVGSPRRAVKADDLPPGPVVGPLPWEEALRRGQYLLDEHGRLKPVVREILQLVADRGVTLSFAHSSKPEMEALAEECVRLGYRQAFIDHPYGPQVGLEFEDLQPFAAAGIWFNFTYDEISPLLGVDPQDMFDTIKALGPEHFTLSSDAGNYLLPSAVDSYDMLVRYGRAYGLSNAELRLLTVENPRKVLGLPVPAAG